MEALGHKTLGWVAMMRKNGAGAQDHFVKSLAEESCRRRDFVLVGSDDRRREEAGNIPERALSFRARIRYDGPGALPAEGRKQVDDYLTKAYTGFHGDTSGLAELKAKAKTAALPPADFTIRSVREIQLDKMKQEEEFNKNNPLLAKWKQYKQALMTDAATGTR